MEDDRDEIAATVLTPYFDAVRDTFASFSPERGVVLAKAKKVRFVIDQKIRNSPRHYAATRDDGLHMWYAPEMVETLSDDEVVAIVSHEFGHAMDFLYPGRWIQPGDGPCKAQWISDSDENTKAGRRWKSIWHKRNADQIEWAADGIAEAVTGRQVRYSGKCIIQCFDCGGRKSILRPMGLR